MKRKSKKEIMQVIPTSNIQSNPPQEKITAKYNNPWPGLAPYKDPSEYGDEVHYKFCGRTAETYDLLQLIENRSLVTLYGSTGIGKTSLLRAGVFPILKQHIDNSAQNDSPIIFHPLYVRLGAPEQLTFDSNIDIKSLSLAEILKLCIEKELEVKSSSDEKIEEKKWLWHYFHSREFYYQKKKVTPVVVLDQFEELFTDRANDKKIEEFLRQLYILVENRLPWKGIEGMHEATFRFVISLREDRFFYLEDFIDSLHLILFKESRYRLRPMTDEQAAQVITIPGANIIDKDNKDKIATNIISKARNKDRQDINTLMLSLICNQIYEREGCLTLKTSQSINLTLDSYYDSAIKNLPNSEIRFIEKKFVNGDTRQPVEESIFKSEAPNAYIRFFEDEDSVFKIVTSVVVPGKDVRHVELVHDQLAAVINARQKAKNTRWNTVFLRTGILILVVIVSLLLVFGGQNTNKKEEQPLSIMRINSGEFSTTDSLWITQDNLKNNAMVERLSIVNKNNYAIEQCPYLHTVDLSNLGQDSLSLILKNCDVLKTIKLPKTLHYLRLEISNCPKLSLNINKGLGDLYINPMEEALNISIDSEVKRYKEWQGILWDIYDRRIVFYPRAVASEMKGQTFSCSFPEEIKTDHLMYGTVTLKNINYKKDSISTSYSIFPCTNWSQDRIDLWARSNDKYEVNRFVLPDSLDHLPTGMFKSMVKLDSVIMPQILYSIETEAFYDCRQLRNVVLSQSLKRIGDRAFMGCFALKHIIIPAEVTYIGEQAFEGCVSLETVEFEGDSVELGNRAFANCTKLKTVKLPRNPIFHAKAEYYSPFYNSVNFIGKEKFSTNYNDAVERNEGYELAWNDESELIIRLSGNASEIYLPIGYVQNKFNIEPDAHTLNHIHIPWPQPIYIKNGKKYELKFNLKQTDKQHITLHVPYGCKRYYELNCEFADFRNIIEDPFSQQILNWINDIALLTKKSISKPISIFFIFSFVLLLFSAAIIAQKKKCNFTETLNWGKIILYSVLFCVFTFVVFTLLLWFFRLYCSINEYFSMAFSAVFALLSSSIFFMASHIATWIGQRKKRRIILNRFKGSFHWTIATCGNFKRIIIVFIAIIFLAIFTFFVHYQLNANNSYSIAMANGNYKKAIEVYIDSLSTFDNLTQSDCLQLRNLLSINGDSAQLVFVAREHYDNCDRNYEVPWMVQTGLSFTRNDSLFMFNTNKMAVWSGKDPFGRENKFLHDANKLTISYYDEHSDSSVIILLQDTADTIKISGKLSKNMIKQKFIISEKKDGQKLIYDLYGRFIPYDKNDYFKQLSNTDFFIIYGDEQSYVFTHTTEGPMCITLPKGRDLSVYDGHYLIWRVDSGGVFVYDVYSPLNSPIIVDKDGYFQTNTGKKVNTESYSVKRNEKDGTVNVTEASTGQSFSLPARFSYTNESISHGYVKNRYFWQSSALYGEITIFDFQKDGQLIAELKGTRCEFPHDYNNAFYIIDNDDLQFYTLEDGNVYKIFNAKINSPNRYTVEGDLRGNYLIYDEVCNSETQHYARMVYSLTIPGAKHIPIINNPVFACGDTLIVVNPQEKNFYFYRYETLEEQLNRSKFVNERQKKKLQQLLKNVCSN